MLTKVYVHFFANVNLRTTLEGRLSSITLSVVKRRKLSYKMGNAQDTQQASDKDVSSITFPFLYLMLFLNENSERKTTFLQKCKVKTLLFSALSMTRKGLNTYKAALSYSC